MSDVTLGPLAALSAGSTILNNAMSEWHADQQMAREKKLMNYQNQLNRANALSAYQTQVEGMRLAGLSPALLNGQTPQIAAPVSKGNVSQGENVEIDPATLLLDAQIKNVNADTEVKEAETEVKQAEAAKISGVDTKNVQADTDLKTAQILTENEKPANLKMDTRKKGFEINKTWAESENLYAQKPNIEAQTGKIKAETSKTLVDATRISQLNEQYKDQNKTLQRIGPQIAREIIDSPAFDDFDESTKLYFNKVADGELKLTVGGIDAVNSLIQSNDKIRSTDKDNFSYTLTKKVLGQQIYGEGSNAVEALAKMPELERQKAEKILDKFTSEIASINADKSLKDENVKLNKLEQAAKDLEIKIRAISPEGMATTGSGWSYLKSLARSYAEEPSKLIAPLGIFKVGSELGKNVKVVPKSNRSNSSSNYPTYTPVGPLKGLISDPNDPHGIQKMFSKPVGRRRSP